MAIIGKVIKLLITICILAVVFSLASIAGVRNDARKARLLAEEQEAERAAAEAAPKEISSPFEQYGGGVLELKMDYEVQLSGDDIIISVVSNLPDSYDLSAELSNVEDVKRQLGLENISASALNPDQMDSINQLTYNQKQKNFVTNGVSDFTFKNPPTGQLDLKITSPITKLQPSRVQELLGDKGENLQGEYVVYLEEVDDRSINFNASFVVEGTEADQAAGETDGEEAAEEATEEATEDIPEPDNGEPEEAPAE